MAYLKSCLPNSYVTPFLASCHEAAREIMEEGSKKDRLLSLLLDQNLPSKLS
jgi:hypothetical protein